jgi:DNA-binding protein HU-beta
MKNEEDFPMNKSELIAALAEKSDFSKKDAEKALNAFVDVISGSLAKGDKVQLIGFGTFDVKKRPARVARNPRTGAEIKIAASKAPAFKAGKALKDKVNTPAKKKGKK